MLRAITNYTTWQYFVSKYAALGSGLNIDVTLTCITLLCNSVKYTSNKNMIV